MNDTIAAIATPQGTGGMAVIRISGPEALSRSDEIFTPFHGKKPSQMAGYTCAYGCVSGQEKLDDCVLTVFRAPHSYTGEDVAEISCHGGMFLTQKILRTILCDRVRLAQAGEFTKRAFLNGKLSLTQAEAVADLISASGENALRCARSLREGATFRRISGFTEEILDMLAGLSVWADYPDEDVPAVDAGQLEKRISSLLRDMEGLLQTYDYGRILREGVHTVIAGRPNVGKSTLFNALNGCERSIVTDIAGTTRDVVEEQIRLGSVTLRLSDTAGVRETHEQIERMGVEKSLAFLRNADLVLAVFDVSIPLSEEDAHLLQILPLERTIAVCNKTDVQTLWKPETYPFAEIVEISAKTGDGLGDLQRAAEHFVLSRKPSEDGMIANERQRECLREAISAAQEALDALRAGIALDGVTVSLDGAADALLQLTGERAPDAVVDAVFQRFCVGK